MIKSITFIVISSLLTIACGDDVSYPISSFENAVEIYRKASFKNALEKMHFTCAKETRDTYFKGKINEVDFCISHDVNGYGKIYGVYNISQTSASNPTLTPNSLKKGSLFMMDLGPSIFDNYNGIVQEFSPWVYINTPITTDTTLTTEKHIAVFQIGPIDINKGFEFIIGWTSIFLPSYDFYKQKSSGIVPQAQISLLPKFTKKEHHFDLVSLEKRKQNRKIHYRFVFEIACELHSNTDSKIAYYGELKDGEFVYELEIDE